MHPLMQKTLVQYVQFALATCNLTNCTFDIWMSKGAHDVFNNTLNEPCQ
jgi:hypothetical protein